MKKLGDLILPESTQWIDRYEWSPVAMETGRTLVGTSVVWSQALSGGRPVTLVAEDGVTWYDLTVVEAIMAMASQAGAVFPLRWGDEVFDVVFRHNEQPAVSFRPVWPHYGRFVGTVKLVAK